VRLEDVDTPRCTPGADLHILRQLADCGLHPDEPPVWQSQRGAQYAQALAPLQTRHLAYPCACTRADIAQARAALGLAHPRHAELVYPGTCRPGLNGRAARAWRLDTAQALKITSNSHQVRMQRSFVAMDSEATEPLTWHDRRLGPRQQDVAAEVGDFVLRRADGLWAYQLAVVVDDAAQGVTHVVRGQDLCDNTPRQILLQRALGLPTPQYLHTPLVRGPDGEKLSKQHGAPALPTHTPALALAALQGAAQALGLPAADGPPPRALAVWAAAWRDLYNPAP
jgi:glutamyl-Q tRNA(Asp) synthetase